VQTLFASQEYVAFIVPENAIAQSTTHATSKPVNKYAKMVTPRFALMAVPAVTMLIAALEQKKCTTMLARKKLKKIEGRSAQVKVSQAHQMVFSTTPPEHNRHQ
jgi:hypothetical protein